MIDIMVPTTKDTISEYVSAAPNILNKMLQWNTYPTYSKLRIFEERRIGYNNSSSEISTCDRGYDKWNGKAWYYEKNTENKI